MTTTHGFRFSQFQATAGRELKDALAASGETIDIESVEQDMGTDGTLLWKLHIRYGDAEKGILYFAQDDGLRSQAIEALAAELESVPGLLIPAVVRSRQTKAGRTYFYLADPQ